MRGAPGATEGSAQVYLGVFSPTRGVYQVSVPGGALLSTPINGDLFGGDRDDDRPRRPPGRPRPRARPRRSASGRCARSGPRPPVAVPLVEADLRLEDGRLKGTVKNASSQRLERPAVVLGQTVAVLDDLEPGAEATIDVAVQFGQFQQSLSDKVVGQFFGNEGAMTPELARTVCSALHGRPADLRPDDAARPTCCRPTGRSSSPGARASCSPSRSPARSRATSATSCTTCRRDWRSTASTTFRADLLRSTVVEADAVLFSKEPSSVNFGRGSVTMAYRPIGFDGRLTATD